ncbi:serine hydrolase domain-containing protein [Salipaludibacillus sp. HK11]|uniref:serine hydrolase domain-containing protein n=1 Tax=Salipaludibacillus sp. HK11 TaxID=3394320 RepID=UPI0039FBA699
MHMELKNINERMKNYHVLGLSTALINRGQISETKCFGVLEAGTDRKVDCDSIFSACSVSKFVTSMLIMKLVEQSILDLDEDVNNRLTTWKVANNECTKRKKVTLRNLLSHQSGIIDPKASFCELDVSKTLPEMVEILAGRSLYCKESIKVTYEPESDFQYSDAGFCVIQQLIEDIFAKPFELVIKEQIFEPLNMKNSTVEQTITISDNFSCGHNKNGHIVKGKYPIYPYPAACGLWTTPSDLAILVMELINSLKDDSILGLSTSQAKDMMTSQGGKAWTGLGVFLDGSEHELEISSLGWGVGFQCMMVASPFLETGAVIMTNAELGVHQMDGIIGEIYKSLKS